MSSAQKDFYRILGLSESAEFAVIKAAYKALIMIYHPDRHVGDKCYAVKKSKDINEAYAVLIDPDKRKKYDTARLGKFDKIPNKSESTLNELKMALKESEAILKILNELGHAPNQINELHEFKILLKESEAILKILNEPD
jgi:curved DNA-binding protein CbpA